MGGGFLYRTISTPNYLKKKKKRILFFDTGTQAAVALPALVIHGELPHIARDRPDVFSEASQPRRVPSVTRPTPPPPAATVAPPHAGGSKLKEDLERHR